MKQVGKVLTATKIYFDATYFNSQAVSSGAVEGTAVLSTGETGGSKFLREDGDGTCSWQTAGGSFAGDMDDIDDGATYVKTENNLTDALVSTIGTALQSLAWGWMIYQSDDANGMAYYYPATRFFDLYLRDETTIALPDPSNWTNEFLILRAYDLGAYAPLTFSDYLDPDLVFTTNGQSVILISNGTEWIRVADYGFGGSADDTAYDATTWDGNTDAPTKNAVRDKFESLTSGGLTQAQALGVSLL